MECETCKYYDKEEEVCGAFECYGIDCPPLPCEEKEDRNGNRKG